MNNFDEGKELSLLRVCKGVFVHFLDYNESSFNSRKIINLTKVKKVLKK